MASHGTDFRKLKAKIHSLEATHQDSGGSGLLGTISKRMCIFFPGYGSIAFIKFAKVTVHLKKVKNTPQKRQHRFQNFSVKDVEKRKPFYTVGGNVRYSRFGKQYGVSFKKLKIELPCDPAVD